MKLKHLQTLGLTSALLLSTFGGIIVVPQVQAESLTEKTQLVAEKANAVNSFVTVEQDHQTTGTIKIISENGNKYLEFDDTFSTAEGPDVQVVLHRTSPVSVNLKEANYITIAPLQSFQGTQRYLLPEDIDLNEYASVAIWCRQFNVTFAYASLDN
jgi:hypothetical protein